VKLQLLECWAEFLRHFGTFRVIWEDEYAPLAH